MVDGCRASRHACVSVYVLLLSVRALVAPSLCVFTLRESVCVYIYMYSGCVYTCYNTDESFDMTIPACASAVNTTPAHMRSLVTFATRPVNPMRTSHTYIHTYTHTHTHLSHFSHFLQPTHSLPYLPTHTLPFPLSLCFPMTYIEVTLAHRAMAPSYSNWVPSSSSIVLLLHRPSSSPLPPPRARALAGF